MIDNFAFRKLLYRVAYVMATLLLTIGIMARSDEIITISWIHLIIGGIFNINYFIYCITKGDKYENSTNIK